MAKPDRERYYPDPVDGLPVEEIGGWSAEKHERLRRYVDITWAARRKFATFTNGGSTYIDLYCGPGRSCIKGTTEPCDGSPVLAARQATSRIPFSTIHIGDQNPEMVESCRRRLAHVTESPILTYEGTAAQTVRQVVTNLRSNALHLAFLDPYSIGALPFSVIETLARVKHMDLIVHVSTMDLQRNLAAMMEDGRLDAFAPGWRDAVDTRQKPELIRLAVFKHWRSLFGAFGHEVSDNIAHVRGDRNQPLYWLVLASRSTLADKFWKLSVDVGQQTGFNFGSTP